MSSKLAGKRKRSDAAHALMVARPYKRKYVPRTPRSGAGETKFHDVDLNDAVVTTARAITATVNIIAQNVTETGRVGRKCTITSFHWRYQVSLPEQDAVMTPASGDTLRIILYQDKQTNAATAAVTDLLESADFQSFRNLANVGRFNFLCDKIHNINYMGLGSDGAGVVSQALVLHNYTFNKKLSIPIEFSGADGTIDEIRSNNIGVLLISGNGVCGLTNSKIRLRFSDH